MLPGTRLQLVRLPCRHLRFFGFRLMTSYNCHDAACRNHGGDTAAEVNAADACSAADRSPASQFTKASAATSLGTRQQQRHWSLLALFAETSMTNHKYQKSDGMTEFIFTPRLFLMRGWYITLKLNTPGLIRVPASTFLLPASRRHIITRPFIFFCRSIIASEQTVKL